MVKKVYSVSISLWLIVSGKKIWIHNIIILEIHEFLIAFKSFINFSPSASIEQRMGESVQISGASVTVTSGQLLMSSWIVRVSFENVTVIHLTNISTSGRTILDTFAHPLTIYIYIWFLAYSSLVYSSSYLIPFQSKIRLVTDVLCFSIGLFSNLPVVRLFCLYTTVALFIDFVYQVFTANNE